MAAATNAFALTETYTAVATSVVSGVVQYMGGTSPMVRIHCGTGAPADGTANYLLIGATGDLFRSFSWNNFTTGDNVYARADRGTANVTVVIS